MFTALINSQVTWPIIWLPLFPTQCDVVVFNVDYRLAPETKAPNNQRDFYEVVKFVWENAEQLGVNPGEYGRVVSPNYLGQDLLDGTNS